jgi:hypothetical protein
MLSGFSWSEKRRAGQERLITFRGREGDQNGTIEVIAVG